MWTCTLTGIVEIRQADRPAHVHGDADFGAPPALRRDLRRGLVGRAAPALDPAAIVRLAVFRPGAAAPVRAAAERAVADLVVDFRTAPINGRDAADVRFTRGQRNSRPP